MSIYKRGSTWYYDVKIGRRRERRAVGPDKAEARAAEDIARGRLRQQKEKRKAAPIFQDFAMLPEGTDPVDHVLPYTFLDTYAKVNMRSYRRVREALVPHLIPFFGNQRLDQVTIGEVNRYVAKRQQEGAAAATIHLEVNFLKSIFSYALELEFIDKSPIHGKKLAASLVCNQRTRYLTYEEFQRLYEAAAEHLRPILIVAVQTGMRKGEMTALTWENVDFGQNRIVVKNTKNGRMRNIPMSDEVRDVLLLLFSLRYHPEKVFAHRNGNPVKDFSKAWYNALERAGFSSGDVHFHDLRHTFATHASEAGARPEELKEILGHSTLKMVLRYTHITDDRLQRAVDGAGRRLGMGKLQPLRLEPRDTKRDTSPIRRKVGSL